MPGDVLQLPALSTSEDNAGNVAKPVMRRWPEQPPVPSNGTLAERHISIGFRGPTEA